MARRPQVITLTGIGAKAGRDQEFREFVGTVSRMAGKAQSCKCVREYRRTLEPAVQWHVASMLDDEPSAKDASDVAEEWLVKLRKCLAKCEG